MAEDSETNSYSGGGNYDGAIVAIAIGDDTDMDSDTNGDDQGFDDIVTGITAAIDDADIDHEETWLRRCTGEIPNGVEANETGFGNLPPEVQMKLVLDLREREKATLLGNLRQFSSVVERLKEQFYESEDKRMELEHELDTENVEVEEMKREFEEMKEAHKCRIKDIERITKEMLVQRERLSKIIEQQQRPPSISSSSSPETLPPSSDSSESSTQDKSTNDVTETTGDVQPRDVSADASENSAADESKRSQIEVDFELKLSTNPQYRAEFERFKEFQAYYQAIRRSHQRETSRDFDSDGDDPRTTLPLGEEYRKMLEFQLAFERILSSPSRKNT